MLELDAVEFRYGADGPDFAFTLRADSGSITAVMGSSGSGKSTLLDLIAGFQRAHAGEMRWAGEPFGHLPPNHRPVTVLFQKNAVFDHLSVETNVSFGLSPRGQVSAADRKTIADALVSVGLAGTGSRRASTLSGGQQQRVALARSLLRDRPILLLDEPFSGLDDETRTIMHRLVRKAARSGRCVLLVTHDRDDAEALGAGVLFMREGRLHVE